MKTTKFLVLAAVTAALAACASKTPDRSGQPSGQGPVASGSSENLSGYPAWKVPADRGSDTTVVVNSFDRPTYNPAVTYPVNGASSTPAWSDYSRASDFQKSISDRLESASREIDNMHGRSATGTDCERRFRYLQVLRDSLKDKVAGLSGLESSAWTTKAYDVNDRMQAIEQYLAADRAACALGR